MSENEPNREKELRINEDDREAIKECRDKCFDHSVALGYVARTACKNMIEDENDIRL